MKAIARVLIAIVAAVALLASTASADQTGRKVKHEVKPQYPEMARQYHVSGTVRLQVVVLPNGRVKDVTPLGGHPLLIGPSEQAVRDWQYEPGTSETTEVVVFNFAGN